MALFPIILHSSHLSLSSSGKFSSVSQIADPKSTAHQPSVWIKSPASAGLGWVEILVCLREYFSNTMLACHPHGVWRSMGRTGLGLRAIWLVHHYVPQICFVFSELKAQALWYSGRLAPHLLWDEEANRRHLHTRHCPVNWRAVCTSALWPYTLGGSSASSSNTGAVPCEFIHSDLTKIWKLWNN